MTTTAWLAAALTGGGISFLVVGLLTRVYAAEEELSDILDLPWGERDIDLQDAVAQRSQLLESTLGAAGALVETFDPAGSLKDKLGRARLPVRPAEFIIGVLGAGLLGAGFLAAATSTVWLGAAALAAAPFAGNFFLSYRINRRTKRFEEQFPEALTLIASSLSAGHTFLRAIQMMHEEAEGPLAEEFGRVVSETELGDPLVDALDRMSQRLGIRDVEWVVQAIRIQQTVGGKLADLLHTLADFIRAREEVRREVDVLTAEGRVSAYVLGGLPAILLLFISVTNPGYMDPMYRGWGWFWLGFGGVMTLGSMGLILRMVKSVEV